MDSDDDFLYDATDSGNESPEEEGEEEEDMQDEVDDFGIDMDPEPGGSHAQKIEDEYPFEVLSTEKIVSNMVESIKEVSAVVQDQIPTTTVGSKLTAWLLVMMHRHVNTLSCTNSIRCVSC